jgi:hypothetical protein
MARISPGSTTVLVPGICMPWVTLWPGLNSAIRRPLYGYRKMKPDMIQDIRDSMIGEIQIPDRLGQICSLVWR